MNQLEVTERIIGVVKDICGESERELTGNTKIENVGVSSIDYVKILIMLEIEFDIEFDDDDLILDENACIFDLANKVYSKIS